MCLLPDPQRDEYTSDSEHTHTEAPDTAIEPDASAMMKEEQWNLA